MSCRASFAQFNSQAFLMRSDLYHCQDVRRNWNALLQGYGERGLLGVSQGKRAVGRKLANHPYGTRRQIKKSHIKSNTIYVFLYILPVNSGGSEIAVPLGVCMVACDPTLMQMKAHNKEPGLLRNSNYILQLIWHVHQGDRRCSHDALPQSSTK
jgi:hypothetical protein